MGKNPLITSVEVRPGYVLRVTFPVGFTGDADMSELVTGSPAVEITSQQGNPYRPLADGDLFAQAHADGDCVSWPGGISIHADDLWELAVQNPVSNDLSWAQTPEFRAEIAEALKEYESSEKRVFTEDEFTAYLDALSDADI